MVINQRNLTLEVRNKENSKKINEYAKAENISKENFQQYQSQTKEYNEKQETIIFDLEKTNKGLEKEIEDLKESYEEKIVTINRGHADDISAPKSKIHDFEQKVNEAEAYLSQKAVQDRKIEDLDKALAAEKTNRLEQVN